MLHVGLFWLSPTLYADPRLSLHKHLRNSLYPLPWSAIAHSTVSPFARSVFSQPKNPVRRTWSLHFGTTLFTVFFERVHSAYGLIRLPWRIVKNYINIYLLEPREGHNWIDNQSPWPGPSDPSHRPAHSVTACFLRLPPFRGRCSSAKLSAGSPFYRLVQSCRRVVACFLCLPYAKRRLGCRCSSGTVLFLYLIIFSIYSVSPVCPFLPLLFASGLRSVKRLFFPLSHSLCSSLLFRSPVHIALQTLRKRYTFFRPGFDGFLPSPPRLAPILAWLSSSIVRFYYLFPF